MQPPISLIFHKRLFILLSLSFIVATVVGTLSHETGHYFAAKYYGFKKPRIHYNYTLWQCHNALQNKFIAIQQRNANAIKNKRPFPEDARYNAMQKEIFRQQVNIGLAGPIETMLTGTIGLFLLLAFRKKYQQSDTLKAWQWLLVFITLFWLRELFNLVVAFVYWFIYHRWLYGDESHISTAWHLPPYAGYALTGSIALIVLAIVVFKFVPVKQRLTFLLAGLAGGIMGAILWLVLLGPVVMP